MMVAYKGEAFIPSGDLVSTVIDEYYSIYCEISSLASIFATALNLVCSLVPSIICYYLLESISWYGLNLTSSFHPAIVIFE